MRSSLADVLKFIQHTLAFQGVLNLVRATKVGYVNGIPAGFAVLMMINSKFNLVP